MKSKRQPANPRGFAGTRAGLFLLRLLAFLPLSVIRFLGDLLGRLFYCVGRERRHVAETNLAYCFPDMPISERRRWVREHFVIFAQALLDRSWLWWGDQNTIARRVRFCGFEHFQAIKESPVIVFAPHFQGLDAAWTLWSMNCPMVSMYSRQKNRVFDEVMRARRTRFNAPVALSRQEGLRRAVAETRSGRPFYYLPDLDFGPDDSLFIPFFNQQAATVPGLPRMARLARAKVLPCVARLTPEGYVIELYPAWDNYPSTDIEADVRRMNAFIEERVTEPGFGPQYHWLHKRFKTRPPGEKKIY